MIDTASWLGPVIGAMPGGALAYWFGFRNGRRQAARMAAELGRLVRRQHNAAARLDNVTPTRGVPGLAGSYRFTSLAHRQGRPIRDLWTREVVAHEPHGPWRAYVIDTRTGERVLETIDQDTADKVAESLNSHDTRGWIK